MKKSLLNIFMVVLLVMNLILTAVMAFSVLPVSSKTNEMITKVCSALSLELKSGNGEVGLKIENMETHDIEEELTITLAKSEGSNADHYAVAKISIVVDTTHEDYEKYVEDITTKESLINDSIRSTISQFTMEEIRANQEGVQKAVLQELQALFDSDFIVRVAFKKLLCQ